MVPDAFSRLCENKSKKEKIVSTDQNEHRATMGTPLLLENVSGSVSNIVSATLGSFRIPTVDFNQISRVHNGVC